MDVFISSFFSFYFLPFRLVRDPWPPLLPVLGMFPMESYTIGRLSSVVDTGRCRSALGVRRMLHGLLIRGKIRLDVRLEIGETLNSLGRRNEGSESEDRWRRSLERDCVFQKRRLWAARFEYHSGFQLFVVWLCSVYTKMLLFHRILQSSIKIFYTLLLFKVSRTCSQRCPYR